MSNPNHRHPLLNEQTPDSAYQAGLEAAEAGMRAFLDQKGEQLFESIRQTPNTFDRAMDDLLTTANPLLGRRSIATNPLFGYGWMEEQAANAFKANSQGEYTHNGFAHKAARKFAEVLDAAHDGLFGSGPLGKWVFRKIYGIEFTENARIYNKPNAAREEDQKFRGITYGQRNALVSLGFMWMGAVDGFVNHWTRNLLGMRGFASEVWHGKWKDPGYCLRKLNPFPHLWRETKWLCRDWIRNVIADAEVGLLYVWVKERGLDKRRAMETTRWDIEGASAGPNGSVPEHYVQVHTARGAREFYVMPFILYNVYVMGVHNTWADVLLKSFGCDNQSDLLDYLKKSGMDEANLSMIQKVWNRTVDATGFSIMKFVEIFSTMKIPAEIFSPLRYFGTKWVEQENETRHIIKKEIELLDQMGQLKPKLYLSPELSREMADLQEVHRHNNKEHALSLNSLKPSGSFSELMFQFMKARNTLCNEYDGKPEAQRIVESKNFMQMRDQLLSKMYDHLGKVAEAAGMNAEQLRHYLIGDRINGNMGSYVHFLKHGNEYEARKVITRGEPAVPEALLRGADGQINPLAEEVIAYAKTLTQAYIGETRRRLFENREYHGQDILAQHWMTAHFDLYDRINPFDADNSKDRRHLMPADRTQTSVPHVGSFRMHFNGPSKSSEFYDMAAHLKQMALEGSLPTSPVERKGKRGADWSIHYDEAARGLQQSQTYASDQGAYGLYIGLKRASNTLVRDTPGLNGQFVTGLAQKAKFGTPVEPGRPSQVEDVLIKPILSQMRSENASARDRFLAAMQRAENPARKAPEMPSSTTSMHAASVHEQHVAQRSTPTLTA